MIYGDNDQKTVKESDRNNIVYIGLVSCQADSGLGLNKCALLTWDWKGRRSLTG